jgi:hypothetical protein
VSNYQPETPEETLRRLQVGEERMATRRPPSSSRLRIRRMAPGAVDESSGSEVKPADRATKWLGYLGCSTLLLAPIALVLFWSIGGLHDGLVAGAVLMGFAALFAVWCSLRDVDADRMEIRLRRYRKWYE